MYGVFWWVRMCYLTSHKVSLAFALYISNTKILYSGSLRIYKRKVYILLISIYGHVWALVLKGVYYLYTLVVQDSHAYASRYINQEKITQPILLSISQLTKRSVVIPLIPSSVLNRFSMCSICLSLSPSFTASTVYNMHAMRIIIMLFFSNIESILEGCVLWSPFMYSN